MMTDQERAAIEAIRTAVGNHAVIALATRESAIAALMVGDTDVWVAVAEERSGGWQVPGVVCGRTRDSIFPSGVTIPGHLASIIWWTPVGWPPELSAPGKSWHALVVAVSNDVARVGAASSVDSAWITAGQERMGLVLILSPSDEIPSVSVETKSGQIVPITFG